MFDRCKKKTGEHWETTTWKTGNSGRDAFNAPFLFIF